MLRAIQQGDLYWLCLRPFWLETVVGREGDEIAVAGLTGIYRVVNS
jgi:hypothetical protein